jgi:hypothetical protein
MIERKMIRFDREPRVHVKQYYEHKDSLSTVEVSETLSEMRRVAVLEPFRLKGSRGGSRAQEISQHNNPFTDPSKKVRDAQDETCRIRMSRDFTFT